VEVVAATDNKERLVNVAALVAFIALAILVGPVENISGNAILIASSGQVFACGAVAALVGGCVLLAYATARRQRLPCRAQWGVLLLLIAPQWCWTGLDLLSGTVPWMHRIGDGAVLLIAVAAPMWLGLWAALDVAEIEVPAACIGTAMAGMFAVLLVVPANSYSLRWVEIPTLAIAIALGIGSALVWSVARQRLAGLPVASTAGAYLLLTSLGDLFWSWIKERSYWQPIDWRVVILPVLCEAALVAASWWLWFWLLQRITLGAFGMRAVAAWAATALPVFMTLGIFQWRVDAAFVIALAACGIALKARVAQEQPTVLGLTEP
jgi:hypothetical protein